MKRSDSSEGELRGMSDGVSDDGGPGVPALPCGAPGNGARGRISPGNAAPGRALPEKRRH